MLAIKVLIGDKGTYGTGQFSGIYINCETISKSLEMWLQSNSGVKAMFSHQCRWPGFIASRLKSILRELKKKLCHLRLAPPSLLGGKRRRTSGKKSHKQEIKNQLKFKKPKKCWVYLRQPFRQHKVSAGSARKKQVTTCLFPGMTSDSKLEGCSILSFLWSLWMILIEVCKQLNFLRYGSSVL